VNTINNAIKQSRSITAAASIQSRLVLAVLSVFTLSSSSIAILVSSRSSILVSARLLEAIYSAAWFLSLSPRWQFSGPLFLPLPSTTVGCEVAFNWSSEASRSQMSRLAWRKQQIIVVLSKRYKVSSNFYHPRTAARVVLFSVLSVCVFGCLID